MNYTSHMTIFFCVPSSTFVIAILWLNANIEHTVLPCLQNSERLQFILFCTILLCILMTTYYILRNWSTSMFISQVSTSNYQTMDPPTVDSHISFLECTITKRSPSIFRGLGEREFCPQVTMPPNHDFAVFTTQ